MASKIEKVTAALEKALEEVNGIQTEIRQLADEEAAAIIRRDQLRATLEAGQHPSPLKGSQELLEAERAVTVLQHAQLGMGKNLERAQLRAHEALGVKLGAESAAVLERYQGLIAGFIASFADYEDQLERAYVELEASRRPLVAAWERGALPVESDRIMRQVGNNFKALERLLQGGIRPVGDQLRMVAGALEGQPVEQYNILPSRRPALV